MESVYRIDRIYFFFQCVWYLDVLISFLSVLYCPGRALELVRTDIVNKVLCKDTSKVMVIISDGYSSDDISLPSLELRDSGVTIFSVGYGEETPFMRYTLETMASEPKSSHMLIMDYGEIIEGVGQLIATICQGYCIFLLVLLYDQSCKLGSRVLIWQSTVTKSYIAPITHDTNSGIRYDQCTFSPAGAFYGTIYCQ